MFKLENLVYLTVFLLPTYLVRFHFFGVPTNLLDCLLVLCLSCALPFLFKRADKSSFFTRQRIIFVFGALVLIGLIGSLINNNYLVGFGLVKSWFVLPILFALFVQQVIPRDRVKNIFFAYYASAFFVALVSLGYLISGSRTFDLRLQGFFNSPNYLAMYLVPAIFIGGALAVEMRGKKRLVVLFSLGAVFLALYFTFSYASWAAFFGAGLFVLAVEKKLDWKKGLITVCLFLVLTVLQVGTNKFSELANFNERSSLASRVMIWRSAEKMLEKDYFWGIGMGNFQTKYLEYQKFFPSYLEWAVPHPHNLFLACWLYGGVFGLVGFLGLILSWFLSVWRTKMDSDLRIVVLGIMAYILLHGLVDTTYFKNDLAVVFWLLFVLL